MTESIRHPRARPELIVNEIPDGFVVFDPRTQQVHLLNVAAAFVFQCCDGSAAEAEIAGSLAESAALPLAKAKEDVRQCLSSLRERNIVDG